MAEIYDNSATGILGTVESKVRKVAEQFKDCDYMFADFSQANLNFDGITKPTILFVLPARGTISIRRSIAYDKPSVQLWFVCPTDFDFDGVENDCKIEAMKRLALRFIIALNQSGLFEQIDDTSIDYNVAYDVYDENLTGIAIYPQLIEEEGIVLCNDASRKPWAVFPSQE